MGRDKQFGIYHCPVVCFNGTWKYCTDDTDSQRPDPGGGWATDTPLPPKNVSEGLCKGAEPGDPSWNILVPQHLPGQDLPAWISVTGLTSPFRCLLVLSLLVLLTPLLVFLIELLCSFTINLSLIKVCGFQKRVSLQK